MSLREPNVTLGPGQIDVRNAWHDMVGRIYVLRAHVDHAIQEGTRGVANDVGYMVMLENRLPPGPERDKERQTAAQLFGYPAEFMAGERLTRTVSAPDTVLDRQLTFIFSGQMPQAINFDTQAFRDYVDLRVQLKDGVLHLLVPRERVTASNADIFVLWMIGSSLVLIAIATLFLRNQVKPIERLAYAAENFGKGRTIAEFKPHGATEVRRAATAFLEMRERIDRFVQQRTEMLAGISHDLKTPLTRMRLQLAMMPHDEDTEAMEGDIADMERMLNEYLEFAIEFRPRIFKSSTRSVTRQGQAGRAVAQK